jgi:hypothetical protein
MRQKYPLTQYQHCMTKLQCDSEDGVFVRNLARKDNEIVTSGRANGRSH